MRSKLEQSLRLAGEMVKLKPASDAVRRDSLGRGRMPFREKETSVAAKPERGFEVESVIRVPWQCRDCSVHPVQN